MLLGRTAKRRTLGGDQVTELVQQKNNPLNRNVEWQGGHVNV